LALQRRFEENHAVSYISADAAQYATDRILCLKILQTHQVPIVPSLVISPDGKANEQILKGFSPPPYVVMHSIGSGRNALTLTYSADDALVAIQGFQDTSPDTPRGVVVREIPPMLTDDITKKYDVKNPEHQTPYHYRVVLVDGEVFGVWIVYSKTPNNFGLNPLQGAAMIALKPSLVDADVFRVAQKAHAAHQGAPLLALDITQQKNGFASVFDMNVSPNPHMANFDQLPLRHCPPA
jgi:hypothetical protein